MAYTWLLHLMVLSVTMATGYISRLDDDFIRCHDAKTRCEAEPGCRDQLDAIPEVCGHSIYSCPLVSRSECRRLLVSLQTHPFIGSCMCNRTEAKADQCFVVFKTIFLHDCITQDGIHSNVSWLEPRQQQQSQTEAQDDDDEEDDEEEDPSDGAIDDDFLPSCIGVRRQCLHDNHCGHLLSEYRNLCPEKKKQNECVASERRRCFGAINSLREVKPELFDCACPMKKRKTKERCERIQWRLANNTCLVTIPYLVHTLKFPELSYEEILTAANKDKESYSKAGNCVAAFKNCNSDSNCRSRLSHLLSECSFGLSAGPPSASSPFHGGPLQQQQQRNATRCDRRACQDAFRSFFLLVRPERTQDLLFCRCPKDPPAGGNERCETVRRALSPPCALVELPPPTCLDLIDRCLNSTECRLRWKNFEDYCAYGRSTIGGCIAGPELCRSSLIAIAGSDLRINCTCSYTDPDKQSSCLEVRNRLKLTNTCTEMAIDNFHFVHATTTTQRIVAEYSSDGASQSDTSHALPDCGRHIGQKIPSFMSMPTVLRIYTNDTDCSEVCQCLRNRSVTCRTLPCAPNQSCKHRDVVYVHGASFLFDDRGQCRCIKGEMVCTKSHISTEPAQGLFLHTGYSISDQYLIEANTEVRFRSESITTKLGTLLNEDSAEQFCSLSLHRAFEGNLVFLVNVSKFSPKQSNNVESCMYPTKMLSNLINSRNSAIVNDAELSIIKVAQVERVKFHEAPATSGKREEMPGNAGLSVIYWGTRDTDEFRLHLILVATVSYLLFSTWVSLKRDVLAKSMIAS